jgi:hypothetical protein
MLPVTVQFIVAMLAYAINERMVRRVEYLREENRVLTEAIRAPLRGGPAAAVSHGALLRRVVEPFFLPVSCCP